MLSKKLQTIQNQTNGFSTIIKAIQTNQLKQINFVSK